jgi:hypothetical protein
MSLTFAFIGLAVSVPFVSQKFWPAPLQRVFTLSRISMLIENE